MDNTEIYINCLKAVIFDNLMSSIEKRISADGKFVIFNDSELYRYLSSISDRLLDIQEDISEMKYY